MEVMFAASIAAIISGLLLILRSVAHESASGGDHNDGQLQRRKSLTPSWLEAVGDVIAAEDLCGVEVLGAEVPRRRLVSAMRAALRRPEGAVMDAPRSGSVLLHGPRGCGKSLLAQAVAAQVADHVIRVSVLDLLRQRQVPPQQLLSAIFRHARRGGPSVLIIDDLQHLFTETYLGPRVSGVTFDLVQEIRRRDPPVGSVVVGIATTVGHDDSPVVQLRRGFETVIVVDLPDHRTRVCLIDDVAGRRAIPVDDLIQLAELTHGMTSADVLEAAERACGRAILVDGPAARLTPHELRLALDLPTEPRWIDDLDLSRSVRAEVDALLVQLLDPTAATSVLITGDRGVGRKTLVRCLARSSGRHVVTVTSFGRGDEWSTVESRTVARIDEAVARRPSIVLIDVGGQIGVDLSPQQVRAVGGTVDRAFAVPGVSVVTVAQHRDDVHPRLRSAMRFDSELFVPLPDQPARAALLRRHLRTVVVRDVSIELLAAELVRSTPGYLAEYARRAINCARHRDIAARESGVAVVTARDLWDARQERPDLAA